MICGCVYCAAEQGRTDGMSGVCVGLGERPEVSMPQAVNQIDWYRQQVAELSDENRKLKAENAELRGDLDTLLNKLATANVYANRRGW